MQTKASCETTYRTALPQVVGVNLLRFLLCAPGNHGPHAAGRAGFMQARLEELVNLWILVFVLDLGAALFDADFNRLVVTESDEIVTPAIPAQR